MGGLQGKDPIHLVDGGEADAGADKRRPYHRAGLR